MTTSTSLFSFFGDVSASQLSSFEINSDPRCSPGEEHSFGVSYADSVVTMNHEQREQTSR